jgi:hypothetical protein
LTYSSLLESVKLFYETGQFEMQSMWALFLPVAGDLGPNIEDHLTTDIVKADGTIVQTYDWYVMKSDAPFWEVSHHEDMKAAAGQFKLTEPGDYFARFYVNTVKFYELPFSVVTQGGSDPYNPSTTYYLNGPWNDYAYVYAEPSEADSQMFLKLWLRAPLDCKEYSFEYKATVKMYLNGALVGMYNEPGYKNCDTPKIWSRTEFGLYHMSADGGGQYNIGELYAKDGSYSMQLFLDDKLYGRYDFVMSGGKIQYQDRQIRDGGAYYPLQYIEGATGAYWIKRKTS